MKRLACPCLFVMLFTVSSYVPVYSHASQITADTVKREFLHAWNSYMQYGIEPEGLEYTTMEVRAKQYYHRPEIIESAYYLYHFTGDRKYLKMGETFFRGIVEHCRTEAGYAYLQDVITKQQADGIESFFFAETLKYFYLLFVPKEVLPFDEVVFMTEAHPI